MARHPETAARHPSAPPPSRKLLFHRYKPPAHAHTARPALYVDRIAPPAAPSPSHQAPSSPRSTTSLPAPQSQSSAAKTRSCPRNNSNQHPHSDQAPHNWTYPLLKGDKSNYLY